MPWIGHPMPWAKEACEDVQSYSSYSIASIFGPKTCVAKANGPRTTSFLWVGDRGAHISPGPSSAQSPAKAGRSSPSRAAARPARAAGAVFVG